MTIDSAEAASQPDSANRASRSSTRSAEIVTLQPRKQVPVAEGCFQSVDDILDRITERAHRVAGL